jgi:hypothetical protein
MNIFYGLRDAFLNFFVKSNYSVLRQALETSFAERYFLFGRRNLSKETLIKFIPFSVPRTENMMWWTGTINSQVNKNGCYYWEQ